MPNIIIPRPGLWKPPAGSVIDFGHPLARGLYSAWNFNENSGASVQDVARARGSGSVAPFTGSPKWQEGLAFSVNNYVSYGDDSYYMFERTTPLTLTCRVFPTTLPASEWSMLGKNKDTGPNFEGWQFDVFNSVLRFSESGGGGFLVVRALSNPLVVGSWYVVTATYRGDSDASNVRLYINGQRVTATVQFNTLASSIVNTTPFEIGQRAGAQFPMTGLMDYARIYTKEMSEEEVEWLYREPYAMFRGPEVMRRYWMFSAPAPVTMLAPGTSGGQIIRRSTVQGF
jgi:hypothetical protein